MKIIKDGRGFPAGRGPVVTLGNFDGIHIGHARILRKVVERARELGCPSAVYTFDPHPLKVVAPAKSPPLILDAEDKAELVSGFGVDYLILASFTRAFASKHPKEFAEDVIVKGLEAREVWVGENFSFGRGKRGNVEHLKKLGAEFGFTVNAVRTTRREDEVVSSSRIRALVASGDVSGARRLLARPYVLKGRVVRGEDVGKALGFPTANLDVTSELVPAEGVYAARVVAGASTFDAVVNIGKAPTFKRKKITVEVHVLDFSGNLYGRKLRVEFIKRLRDETAFPSVDDLRRQIEMDVTRARRILERERGRA